MSNGSTPAVGVHSIPSTVRLWPGDDIVKADGGTLIGERFVLAETGVSFRLAMAAWTPTWRNDDRDGDSLISPSGTDAMAAMGSVSQRSTSHRNHIGITAESSAAEKVKRTNFVCRAAC